MRKYNMSLGKILLGHGSGGRLMHSLIKDLLLKKLNNPILKELSDSALINYKDRIAFTTDSFVVSPLFFPGGDIGKLAVCGTIKAKEVVIEMDNWCDYRLDPAFKRMNAQEKLNYILSYGHLPEMDPGDVIEKNGLYTGKNLKGMMANIEDNTMDIIELYQVIKKQNEVIDQLKKEVEQLKPKK